MIKPIPPRRRRRAWWVALAVALGLYALADSPAVAQATKTGQSSKKEAAPPPEQAKTESDVEEAEEKQKEQAAATRAESPDRWEDPNAAEALKNTYPETRSVNLLPAEKQLVDQLSKGQGQLDRTAIDHYIQSYTADLTNHRYLQALMDPVNQANNKANTADAKKIETATTELLKPLLVPANNANEGFRKYYVSKLIDNFKPLWKGNLYSRTMAMIVLSYSGDPQAIPVFVAQLNDQDQLAVVKLRAAVGISILAQNGRRGLEARQVSEASKALNDFLVREPETFWPAQFRALEALGSLRQATEKPLGGKAEFAETAMTFLTNPKAAPDVRAWAGWALGMMEVPQSVRNYNFPLVANALGQAAADIGTRIAAMPDVERSRAARVRMANLLVQLGLAFTGEPGVRGSGLLHSTHPSAGAAMPAISETEKRVRSVTKAAVELGNAVGANIPKSKENLVAAVDDLRSFLAKPLPGGRTLFAGGQEFPAAAVPKVATGARP